MSEYFISGSMLLMCIDIVAAAVLAYGIATSKVSSRKIIRTVLIVMGICLVLTLLTILGINSFTFIFAIYLFSIFMIEYSSYIGQHTGNKFNAIGVVSFLVYIFALFNLPLISNKYEDSDVYEWASELAENQGVKLTPSQWDICNLTMDNLDGNASDSMKYIAIISVLIIILSAVLFCLMLIRKNSAQIVVGSMITLLTAGMLYFDYSLYHSKTIMGNIFGKAFSELGFSMSISCVIIVALPVLFTVMAFVCNQKDKKRIKVTNEGEN